MQARVLLRRVEYALWIAGALATGFCAGVFIEARIYQTLENQRLEEALKSGRPQVPVPAPHREARPVGSLVGRLEIPRLKFSAIVLEGSDNGTLRLGVGRIPETADPGEKGNVVLSGHRDTFFRPLRGIRDGDRIVLVTPGGRFDYVVDWTTVVNPSDTTSLMPTSNPALTLVTCYPFHYVGAAPERFIVRARQVERGAGASGAAGDKRVMVPARQVEPATVEVASYTHAPPAKQQVHRARAAGVRGSGVKVAAYARRNRKQSLRR